jgi:DNA-3-methyladenine glycosylase II
MRRIETDDDVRAGLKALLHLDPTLAPVIAEAGPVPLRRRAPGFTGLARIVVSQQVSAAAAEAIWTRFTARLGGDPTSEAILALEDAELKAGGLSSPKVRTLRAMAEAARDGLDVASLADRPAEEAIEALVRIKGIGPWTAEVWLLFCAGHPDVWPAGDLALRIAVGEAFGHPERPSEADCRARAEAWSPWRGVAARLFWAWYGVRRAKGTGLPA